MNPLLLTTIKLKLENHKLKQELEIDSLSGLYSRSGYYKRVQAVWEESIAKQKHLSFAFIDLDNLKQINTEHGHIKGSEIISTLGRTIKSKVRHTDIAGRFGGDEFVICFPNTSIEGAYTACLRIKTCFNTLGFSVSTGLLSFQPTARCLLSTKEEKSSFLLLQAKAEGKNKIKYQVL